MNTTINTIATLATNAASNLAVAATPAIQYGVRKAPAVLKATADFGWVLVSGVGLAWSAYSFKCKCSNLGSAIKAVAKA